MADRWEYRDDRGHRERYERPVTDRAGDEVRSWFGDDEAARRRRIDEARDDRHDRDWSDRAARSSERAWERTREAARDLTDRDRDGRTGLAEFADNDRASVLFGLLTADLPGRLRGARAQLRRHEPVRLAGPQLHRPRPSRLSTHRRAHPRGCLRPPDGRSTHRCQRHRSSHEGRRAHPSRAASAPARRSASRRTWWNGSPASARSTITSECGRRPRYSARHAAAHRGPRPHRHASTADA